MHKIAIQACTIGVIALIAASMPGHSVCAQETQMGRIDFPTSGAAEAQPDFIRGVLLLHSFEYAPARAAFQKAQAVDPDFAMAYWGEAMTHHHSLWGTQALQLGQDALTKLGATHEERTAKAATDREKGFIGATEILFGLTEKTAGLGKVERDVHYRNAMRDVFEANPGDMEARAFGSSPESVGGCEFREIPKCVVQSDLATRKVRLRPTRISFPAHCGALTRSWAWRVLPNSLTTQSQRQKPMENWPQSGTMLTRHSRLSTT